MPTSEEAEQVIDRLNQDIGEQAWVESIGMFQEAGEGSTVRVYVHAWAPRTGYEHLLAGTGRINGVLVRVKRLRE